MPVYRPQLGPHFDGLGVETPGEDLQALCVLAELACARRAAWRMAEVGSWAGRTALALVQAAVARTRRQVKQPGLLYCVDTWEGTPGDATGSLAAAYGPDKVYETFCRNVRGRLLKSIIPLRGTSQHWAAAWPARHQLDLVFLDGAHDYEAVKADIRAWRPLIRPHGILCGHDYGYFDGVTRAVDELVPAKWVMGRTVWWVHLQPG